jgi:hypothetical protein
MNHIILLCFSFRYALYALILCLKQSGTDFVITVEKKLKMKNFTLLLVLLLSFTGFSQRTGEVAIFDNSGYTFHVILNGVMQNEKAESNVRIQGLQANYYSAKIMANDNSFSLDKNIIVKNDTLITYRIVNKRGKFKLRFFSEMPLKNAPAAQPNQSVIAYHTETASNTAATTSPTNTSTTTQTASTITNTTEQASTPTHTSSEVNTSVTGPEGSSHQTVSSTVTTTETTEGVHTNTSVGSGEESISVSMSVGEHGASVNVQGTGMDGEESVQMNSSVIVPEGTTTTSHSTTTTTSTTSTTTSMSTSENWGMEEEGTYTPEEPEVREVSDFSNCFVGEEDFDLFLRMMKQETFEDDKTSLTTDFVGRKCLSVAQIGTLMDELTFSDNQMAVAKAAYPLCYESSDYLLLQEKFTFSDDKEELRNFINNQ